MVHRETLPEIGRDGKVAITDANWGSLAIVPLLDVSHDVVLRLIEYNLELDNDARLAHCEEMGHDAINVF
jgi:hypothetical protein